MRRVVILGVAVAMGLAGCVAPGPGDAGREDLSNEAILARDRARLAANLPMLVRQSWSTTTLLRRRMLTREGGGAHPTALGGVRLGIKHRRCSHHQGTMIPNDG